MQELHDRLTSDYTLFNLNDPEVTKFYVKNIDYLITNFPYFKDIFLVSEYFTSTNSKFNSKFLERITKFLDIIHYNSNDKINDYNLDDMQSSLSTLNTNNRVDNHLEGTHANISNNRNSKDANEKIDFLFPKDNNDEQIEIDDSSSYEDQIGINDSSSYEDNESESSESNKTIALDDFSSPNLNVDESVNHIPKLTETKSFNTNDTNIQSVTEKIKNLLKEDKNLKSSSLTNFKEEPKFPNHFPKGNEFTINSTKRVMKCYVRILIHYKNSFIITKKFIKALISKIEFEEINYLFLNFVKDGNMLLNINSNDNILRIIEKNISTLSYIIEEVLKSDKNEIEDEEAFFNEIIKHKDILLNKFLKIGLKLKYIEQSNIINSKEETESTEVIEESSDESIDNKMSNDESNDSKVLNSETNDNKSSNDEFDDVNILNNEISNYTLLDNENETDLKSEMAYLFKVVCSLCSYRSNFNVPLIRITTINRFTLYYIRLMSYNSRPVNNILLNEIINLFFEHKNNSYLQVSVLRMLIKVSTLTLVESNLFSRLYEYCYKYAAADMNGICTDSLFAFLIRIYTKYSDFIKNQYPEWEDLHNIMKSFCDAEKIKYKVEDLKILEEYSGFKRYVIRNMLNSMPYPSIFENKKEEE